jgi:hypothetical protein
MAMDDPWGSPWADEVQNEVPPPAPTKEEDEGPKTPVKALLPLERKAHDLWGIEDDGFGEWASLPVEEGVMGGELAHDAANEQRDTMHKGGGKEILNEDLDGHTIPWGDTEKVHGRRVSSLVPRLQSDILRQPSPDPWPADTTSNEEGHKKNSIEIQGTDSKISLSGGLLTDSPQDTVAGSASASVEHEPQTQEKDLKKIDGVVEGASDDMTDTPTPTKGATEDIKGKNPEIDQESSRPSSSPSDHDEILPESPRTSLDEDPKRPTIPRKVSSKIQELVHHFDGLSRTESVEEGDLSVTRTSSDDDTPVAGTISADESDDDFGDFEDGQPEVTEDSTKDQVEPSADMEAQVHDNIVPSISSPPLPLQTSASRTLTKDFGRVRYNIDSSALDGLYSSHEELPEKVFVPDVVPHDSFSTVEQRKTWYRVSRYGTMRKHNAGDDENYVRVNWTQSTIRSDTLKIVARWMEEDRISGRVVLGGGSKGSSLFGWNDANAAAVPLATAFAAKQGKKKIFMPAAVETEPDVPREWPKGLVRTRSTSKTRTPPKPRRRTSSKSRRNSEEPKPPTQPVANFGWNMNSKAESGYQNQIPLASNTDNMTQQLASLPRQPSRKSAGGLSPILSPTISSLPKSPLDFNGLDTLVQPSVNSVLGAPPTGVDPLNQDDDWGEMMSSPINPAPPILASGNVNHKKSHSLAGAFRNVAWPSPAANEQSPPTSVRSGHRPVGSLDNLSLPKTEFPADFHINTSSLDVFAAVPTTQPTHTLRPLPPKVSAVPVLDVNSDPWASADFSFFESTPAPSLNPRSVPVPVPVPVPAKVVASTPSASVPRDGKTKSEIEQDRIVASIVKSLPDLSYMLRK